MAPSKKMLLLPTLLFTLAAAIPSPEVAYNYKPTKESTSHSLNPHAKPQGNYRSYASSYPVSEYPPNYPHKPEFKPTTPANNNNNNGGGYTQSYAYGCYTEPEDHKHRALTGPHYANYTSMTLDECEYFCTGSGYRLWGVEYSGECYCGNHLSHGSFPTFPDDCDLPCPGDKHEYCGGSNRLSLYGTEPHPPRVVASSHPAVYKYNYLGCWTEGDGVRALSGASVASEKFMTVERCGNYCIDSGFTVFGVEYGSECYCGHELARSSYVAYGKECDMACSGKHSEVCGGRDRLSLYHWV